jgi:plasmid stabilization system protein ParE
MQTCKVILSDLAKTDLQSIVAYLSIAESLTRAKHVERGILSAMKSLERLPTAYPRDEYASTDKRVIRFVMKWHYKILFFVDTSTSMVQIAGIFHTAQNPDKLKELLQIKN